MGSALGLAAMTAVAASQGANELGNIAALTDGYAAAFIGAAGIALAGAVLAAVLLRTPKENASRESDTPIADREPLAA